MRFFNLALLMGLILFSTCGQGVGNEGGADVSEISEDDGSKGYANPVFERLQFDFGNLISGEKVTYSFRFENQGTAPLVVHGVRTGCGCTVSDYPKDPILPGQTGRIKVDFDSTGRSGKQVQTVQVLTNAYPAEYQLTVTAEVFIN